MRSAGALSSAQRASSMSAQGRAQRRPGYAGTKREASPNGAVLIPRIPFVHIDAVGAFVRAAPLGLAVGVLPIPRAAPLLIYTSLKSTVARILLAQKSAMITQPAVLSLLALAASLI